MPTPNPALVWELVAASVDLPRRAPFLRIHAAAAALRREHREQTLAKARDLSIDIGDLDMPDQPS